MIKCPSCSNGYYATMLPHKLMTCSDCAGKGVIDAEVEWQKDGEYLRNARLRKNISLRDFCKKHDLDPATVSKVERGIIECPDTLKFKAAYNV